jgi:hypothetical protein
MRLAWFTPFPPDRSGIAAYSAELLPLLAAAHQIDVFVDRAPAARASGAARHGAPPCSGTSANPAPPGFSVRSAHDFPWRHARSPYDLVVYQLGNASCHDYMWAYFPRYPGLVVLHDAQVHQARAKQLLAAGRAGHYAAELRDSHPEAPAGLEDLIGAGLGGALFYVCRCWAR